MILTPEQFKEIFKETLRDELENFVTKDEFNEKFDKVMDALDGIAKNVEDSKIEKVSNQASYDRMQGEIVKIKEHVGLTV